MERKSRQAFLVFAIFAMTMLSGCLQPARQVKIRIDSQHDLKIEFIRPLHDMRVVSAFGKRRNWYHTGIDLVGSKKVLAAQSGLVTDVSRKRKYGKIITIKHQYGYKTRYAHLKKFKVKEGDKVSKGQVIGIVGRTGNARGPHLHFEIKSPNGRFINPRRALK